MSSKIYLLFLLCLVSVAVCGVCDTKLQYCFGCDKESIPFVGDVCANPFCIAQGCPDNACYPSSSVTLCSIFSPIQSAVDSINSQVSSLTAQVTSKTKQLTDLLASVAQKEALAKISDIEKAFENDFVNVINGIGPALTGLENTIKAGFEVPIQTIKLFPKLLNNIDPDVVSGFLLKRGSSVVDWFTGSLAKVAKGLGNGPSCGTCLYDNLQNGAIQFSLAVSDAPALTISIAFTKLGALNCFVQSIGALAVTMADLFPSELAQDAFEAASEALAEAAEDLSTFASSIQSSKVCNRTGDILPKVSSPDTGIDVVDTLLKKLTDFVNLLGNDGVFGKVANTFVEGICATGKTSDTLIDFAGDVRKFAQSVSIPNIEDQIFKAVFDVISKLSNGLATFQTMDLSIPDGCDPKDTACRLIAEFGRSYLQCVQKNIVEGKISLTFSVDIGEHWLPPSITGWAIGVYGTVEAYACFLGIQSGIGSVKNILKLVVNEIIGSKSDENSRKACPNVKTCNGGTWDSSACACRCAGAFLTSGTGCQLCPVANGNVCNGKGYCYVDSDAATKCCCTGGVTSPNCA